MCLPKDSPTRHELLSRIVNPERRKKRQQSRYHTSLPRMGNAIKLSKILIAHVGNSVCFFHAFFLKVNNKTKN